MTIESVGYAGTFGHGSNWAELQFAMGNRYYVEDPTALAAVPIVGGLRLGAGRFGGWGVADRNTDPLDVTWAGPGEGETRYYLVVARRDWDSGETTVVVLDPGWLAMPAAMPAPAVGPNVYNKVPGDVDDQPLYVVPWSFGNSQPSAPLGVRLIGAHESFLAEHDLTLAYADWAGIVVRRGTATYRRILGAGGALAWEIDGGPDALRTLDFASGAAVMSPLNGWTVHSAEVFRDGNQIDLYFQLGRTGPTIVGDATGNVGDQQIATIAAPYRPPRHVFYSGVYRGGAGAAFTTWTGEWYLHPNGGVWLQSLAPGAPLKQYAGWSTWTHQHYARAN